MNEEWLEEVDESDRVVGRHPRREIHRLGLRHRSVHILLFDLKGRLFLQRRSMRKDVHPGAWDTSAAGHVDPGETYEESALRELYEELGIRPATPLEFLFKTDARATTGWEFIQVYRTVHAGPFELNRDEIDDGQWLIPTDIDRWCAEGGDGLTATFRYLWQYWRRMR
jgi:isopentenyldiphosphate isomerase